MNIFRKTGICPRCHKETKLLASGYCKTCDSLKNTIEKIQESYYAGDHTATENEYNFIKSEFAYNRLKLDLDSAETTDELSGIEKTFLSTLDSNPADYFYLAGEWIYQHFIDANYLVSKFLKNGFLEIKKSRSFESMTIPELKKLLKMDGLKSFGTKADLITAAQNLSQEQVENFFCGGEFLRLTEKGRNAIGKMSIISADSEMESECISLILQNKLSDAWTKVCEYESKKLVKRGIGTDWNNAKKIFHLTMKTELSFALPKVLHQYEKELRAAVIYCNMMGTTEVTAKRFFLSRNKIDFDKSELDKPIHAMMATASGVKVSDDFLAKSKTEGGWKFSEDALDVFIANLNKKAKEAKLSLNNLNYTQMSDGTLNFTYKGCQIGRIKFGKRNSAMQIISQDFVDWLKNEPLEVYLEKTDKWIKAAKLINEIFES